MRGKLLDALFDRMAQNPDLFFLTADMGINLVERFGDSYPDRFLNVGIAEQNLIGVSAGLANLGYRPFAYTISNFLVHRCYEQVRNDLVLHGYPVTLIGTSAGYDNAPLGPTHHIIDDWGLLRNLPGIDIYAPCTTGYAAKLVDKLLAEERPAYVRVAKGGMDLPELDDDLALLPAKDGGHSVLIASYGSTVQSCLKLRESNPDLAVLVFNRLRPFDEERVADAMNGHGKVLVVEDHFGQTGLYGALCELAMRRAIRTPIVSLAPTDYDFRVGTTADVFYRRHRMDAASILEIARGEPRPSAAE